jgi:hypothetical protein
MWDKQRINESIGFQKSNKEDKECRARGHVLVVVVVVVVVVVSSSEICVCLSSVLTH